MPYASINSLPKYVKKYSKKIQKQFMHVFNSVWDKLKKEGVKKEEREKRAFKAANSVLSKRPEKSNAFEKNSQHDLFMIRIDKYLGNL